MLPHLSPRCLNVTAKCFLPQIICSAGCSGNTLQHPSCRSRAAHGPFGVAPRRLFPSNFLNGAPGNQPVTSPCSFSSFPGCLRPHCTLEGWKTLRFSYRLRVSSFAKLLDMRVRQDLRNHKSYQRHSSTFISLFPLSERSHMVRLN